MRGVEAVGWLAVAVAGVVMLSQAFGWAGFRTLAVVQSITPYLALGMAPVAIVALVTDRTAIAATAAAIGIGGLVLARPILRVAAQPTVAEDAVGIRVAAVNLLYTNDRIADVASDLADRDLDVIVFSEYTPEHQSTLRTTELADAYDFQIDRVAPVGGGTAVWTRFPVDVDEHPGTGNHNLDLSIATDHGPIRVIAVHPPTPIHDFVVWRRDLYTTGHLGRTGDTPTVIVGDLNASFWHPTFRALLRDGYTDAHIANGRGLSVSWPTNRTLPPFVRLDHALVTDRLVATEVEDFDVPGSDHRGFVVTVARAR